MSRKALAAVERPDKPYPGLRPFEAHEWSIFFGRERMIDDVIDRLAQNRLVLIHGASGSGKSSLVRAGVMPKLARQHRRYGTPWLTCAVRPSGGPLWNLASELARLEGSGHDIERIGAVVNLFNKRNASLAQVVGCMDGLAGKSVCLLVDQFEELFHFEKETSREEAELFVELIARARRDGDTKPRADVHVVVTMRSEFLGQCARFAGLADTINQTQYLVPRIDDDALLRAVRRPAQLYGGFVDEDLAYRLISRVRGREDELPLLQHGLMLMWDEAVESLTPNARIVLDGRMVEEAGGLAELLSGHADRVMVSLAPDSRCSKIVEMVFRALTELNAEGTAIRRPQRCAELAAVANTTVDELRPILDAFRASGVSFLTPYGSAPIGENTVIDISHEALIRCWAKINASQDGWLKREFDDGLAWRSLVSEAQSFHRNPASVLSPAATADRESLIISYNEAWTKRYGDSRSLVEKLLAASRKSADKERRRSRFALISLSALAVGAFSLACISISQWHQSQLQSEVLLSQVAVSNILYDKIIDLNTPHHSFKTINHELFDQTQDLARGGNLAAEHTLGLLYHGGFGVERNYRMAFNLFFKTAQKGYPRAYRSLGYAYYKGDGVAQDYDKARYWFEKAVAAGDAAGENSMGILYNEGAGVPKDSSKARDWFTRAALAGNADAMFNLGIAYEQATGVSRDYVAARNWYQKAVAIGQVSAMVKLGVLYNDGKGVSRNPVKARGLYERAAANGDPIASYLLAILYREGDGVAKSPAIAREWYEKAASAGYGSAMLSMGLLYEDGDGQPKDISKAIEWYKKAADAGNTTAMRYLGNFSYSGQGMAPDHSVAREWFGKAAAAGDAVAMRRLGLLYQDGDSVTQDYVKARTWYQKGAEAGDAASKRNMGILFASGLGMPRDASKARAWFEDAANAGDPVASRALGMIYSTGDGVAQNHEKARDYYEKAVNDGDQEALGSLGWELLLTHDISRALAVLEQAHREAPSELWIETNRAHALMLSGRSDAAKVIYLSNMDRGIAESGASWQQAISRDFTELRRAGFNNPLMSEVEEAFAARTK